MQINAQSTVLAAQQQAARPQKPAAFEPLDFKEAEKPAETRATRPPATGPVRPGTHLDIKV